MDEELTAAEVRALRDFWQHLYRGVRCLIMLEGTIQERLADAFVEVGRLDPQVLPPGIGGRYERLLDVMKSGKPTMGEGIYPAAALALSTDQAKDHASEILAMFQVVSTALERHR